MIKLEVEVYRNKYGHIAYNVRCNEMSGWIKGTTSKKNVQDYINYFFETIKDLMKKSQIYVPNKRKLKMQVIESEKNVFQKKD